MEPLAGMMKALGTPDITPDLKRTIVDGVMREASNRSVEQFAEENETAGRAPGSTGPSPL